MVQSANSGESYKELSAELAVLLSDLEKGEMDVDEAVSAYRRGLAIVKQLETYLRNAENTVMELKESLDATQEEE